MRAGLGLILAFVFAMICLTQVLDLGTEGSTLAGEVGTFFGNLGPLFLIVVLGSLCVGAVMAFAHFRD